MPGLQTVLQVFNPCLTRDLYILMTMSVVSHLIFMFVIPKHAQNIICFSFPVHQTLCNISNFYCQIPFYIYCLNTTIFILYVCLCIKIIYYLHQDAWLLIFFCIRKHLTFSSPFSKAL